MKIIQLINGYSKGDGVGNVVAAFDTLLRKMGFDSEIHNKTLSLSDVDSADYQKDTVLLYHVALSVDPLVCFLKCKKIMIFHNITDPRLLLGSGLNQMRTMCSAGLYDIRCIADYFDLAIVFSEYSKSILVDSGWNKDNIRCIPIIVRFEKLSTDRNQAVYKRFKDGKVNILFTGRVFPNKKQESLIYAFKEYKATYNNDSRLLIVGSHSNMAYYDALKRIVHQFGMEEDVIFTGRVSLSEYVTYYAVADVFLCMSEHEGFCIPLVEAMHFNVPIVALNRTAISDTLAGCGVLLEQKDFRVFAKEINRIITDDNHRNYVLKGQRQRMEELTPDVLEKEYIQILKECVCGNATESKYKMIESESVIGEQISIPNHFFCEKNIIYGFGSAGNRLAVKLSEIGIDVIAVCDGKKGGTEENGVKIENPRDVIDHHKDANFIISIQSKEIIKSIICMLRENGIPQEKIYLYDEINESVV